MLMSRFWLEQICQRSNYPSLWLFRPKDHEVSITETASRAKVCSERSSRRQLEGDMEALPYSGTMKVKLSEL